LFDGLAGRPAQLDISEASLVSVMIKSTVDPADFEVTLQSKLPGQFPVSIVLTMTPRVGGWVSGVWTEYSVDTADMLAADPAFSLADVRQFTVRSNAGVAFYMDQVHHNGAAPEVSLGPCPLVVVATKETGIPDIKVTSPQDIDVTVGTDPSPGDQPPGEPAPGGTSGGGDEDTDEFRDAPLPPQQHSRE
jgi:hypothetical protein